MLAPFCDSVQAPHHPQPYNNNKTGNIQMFKHI